MRIGQGFDIHRLVPGRKLIIGGVDIPFEKGLLGHSDADVLFHAITDALLGACALGDIGTHFPDSDPQFKDINSAEILKAAAKMVKDAGFRIENIDCTVKIENPKMAPHIQNMRRNIATALNLKIEKINVKAKTNEGMGEVGAGEAAEADAVCLVIETGKN